MARIEPLGIHEVDQENHHKVDDTLWSEMRQHFSEAEIIEPHDLVESPEADVERGVGDELDPA